MDPAALEPLAAGRVGAWRVQLQRALQGEADADVPCDGCTACCRSSQFVPVLADEADARAAIPAELLFPMPGRTDAGLLGYTDEGHCPMLVEDRCTIYEHRPRACRVYDCRAFAATGVDPDADAQPDIAARVRRWRFEVLDDDDRATLDALQAAGRWVHDHGDELPAALAPTTQVHRALLAFELHAAFGPGPDRPPLEGLIAALEARFGQPTPDRP